MTNEWTITTKNNLAHNMSHVRELCYRLEKSEKDNSKVSDNIRDRNMTRYDGFVSGLS